MASRFSTRPTGEARQSGLDRAELARGFNLFADPAAGLEVFSILQPGGAVSRVVSGNNPDAFVASVEGLPSGIGVYWTINPVAATLRSRPKVGDILRRRWLLIDVDPRKAEGHQHDSATDGEYWDTREVAMMVLGWLSDEGWPLPVVLDSGNGTQLLYRVDLPADALTRAAVKAFTKAAAAKFHDQPAVIDESTAKANQGAKVPGTMARKGTPSDDRPHRPVRLVNVPAAVEVVTFEQIAAVAGFAGEMLPEPPKPEVNGHDPSRFKQRTTANDASLAWAERGMAAECARVAMAAPRTRNDTLASAAFKVGQLLHLGILRQRAESELAEAARHVGLFEDGDDGERKTYDTIRRQLDFGMTQPREPKDDGGKPSRKGAPPEPEEEPPERLTVCGADVKPKRVDWFWHLRIPKRFVTVFAGRTGIGKSFVLCDVIARVTTGREVPEGTGECFEVGGALFISEDPHDYMLSPRLIEAGADMRKVHFMTWEAMAHYELRDTNYLGRAWEEAGRPKLIVIDPPSNFVGDADAHKDTDVRRIIMRIVAWLADEEHDVAVVFILHVNKQTGKGIEALNRVMGSVAWTTTCRIAHTFAPDPEQPDVAMFVPMKSNIGPLPKGLGYRFKPTETLAVIEWLGAIDTTADEAMAGLTGKPRRVVAAAWLIERFREKLEWRSKVLFAAAAQEGISRDAIFEAKRTLKLPKAKKVTEANGDEHWVWWVPAGWSRLEAEEVEQPEPEEDDAE